MNGLPFAVAAALLWGGGSYIGGRASRVAPPTLVVLWGLAAALAVAVPAALVEGGRVDLAAILWGTVAGLFATAGAIALYQGLANARAAVVAPLAGVVGAGLPTLFGVALGERPDATAWAGVGIALPAIWLLASDRLRLGPGAGFGIAAGLGFGAEFVILGMAPERSGLWPVVGTLLGGIVVAGAGVWGRKLPFVLGRRALVPATTAALFNLGAVTAFLFASRLGLISLSSVVASLYPAPTVALAAIVDRERIRPVHLVGGSLALVAVGLIAA